MEKILQAKQEAETEELIDKIRDTMDKEFEVRFKFQIIILISFF